MTRWPLLILVVAIIVAVGALLVGRSLAQDKGAEGQEDHAGHRHEGPVNHSFADVARFEERFEGPERAEWQRPDEVVAALKIEPGSVVADIGSGTGYFSRRFAAAVGPRGTVFASDIEPNMAAYVRDRADREGQANIVPVLASTDDPRLPDGGVDLVFICDTWHHIGDRVDYARRLRTDLAAGGRVVIVDFHKGELPVGPPPEHKLSPDDVKADFAQAGYRLVAAPDFLPYQYVLVFAPDAG